MAPQFAYFGDRVVVGGYARSLMGLALAQDRDHEVRICAHLPHTKRVIDGSSVELVDCGGRRGHGGGFAGAGFVLLGLAAVWRQRRWADVVHVHSGYADYLLLSWLVRTVCQLIVVHSLYCPVSARSMPARIRVTVLAVAARRASVVVGMSENVCRSVRLLLRRADVQRVPPAVDSSAMLLDLESRVDSEKARLGLDTRFPIYLFVGNTSPTKNLARTMEAFARVRKVFPNAVLVVTTELPASSPLGEVALVDATAGRLGISSHVLQLKVVHDMPALIGASDVVVTPFISSAGPSDYFMVGIEAMLLGRHLVSSDVGGMREILAPGQGQFVDPHEVHHIAKAMLAEAYADDPTKDTIRATRELFDPVSVARQINSIYLRATS